MDPIPSWQNRTPDHNATNSGDHVAGSRRALLVFPQVLIHRLPTDSIRARQIRLGNPRLSLCNEFMGLYRPKGFLPALVDSLSLSNSNAFALPLSNQISLELS